MKWLATSAVLFVWAGCSSDEGTNDSTTDEVEASCLAELGQTVSIAAGSFTMGCDGFRDLPCYPDEQPAHEVTLAAFRIDVHEVAVGAYRVCVDAAGCTEPTDLSNADCSYPVATRENYPVNCITWKQARDYCAFVGGRLPTEAEWERAARGTDRRPYAWGEDDITCEHANYSGCQPRARPVGCHAAGVSPEGLHDTAGNVAEFTADWFDNTFYKNSPAENPTGPDSGEHPVVRGGSYYDFPDFQRATFRGYDDDTAAKPFDYIGVRCAYSE